MPDSTYFMAFAVTERLHRNAEDFIQRFVYSNQPGDRPHALLQDVMDEFIYECLRVYFIETCAKAGLSPTSRKIVDSTVAAIRKTVGFVLSKIVQKLDRTQMKEVALYMDSVMQRERGNLAIPAWIAFPLPNPWVENFRQLVRHAEQSTTSPEVQPLIDSFNELTDMAIKHFFEAPLLALSLGQILRRMAEMGIDTTRAATRTLLKQIFKTMTLEQTREVLRLFNAMIVLGPAHKAAQRAPSAYELA